MKTLSSRPITISAMDTTNWCSRLLVCLVLASLTYPATVALVMSLSRDASSPSDAVALVMRSGNASRLRLVLQKPAQLFALLVPQSPGSQNEDLAEGDVAAHVWTAVDSDHARRLFYVMDLQNRSIEVVDLTTNQLINIYTGISRKAKALAVNWLDNAVYWTDAAYDAIFIYRGTGSCRLDECVRTVVSWKADTPTGLAVHPHRDFLFWTDVRGTVGRLHRSDLSGGGQTTLFEQLSQPSAVAIDYRTNRVYWLAQSGDNSVVETSDLDGGDRYSAAVLADARMRDLDVIGGLLVMTEPQRGELVMHDVIGNVTRTLVVGGVPHGVCVFSADMQDSEVRSERTVLAADRDVLHEGFLVLVSEQGSLSMLAKTALTSTREVTASLIVSLDSVTAIAADVGKKFLYFFDRNHGSIERLSLSFLSFRNSSLERQPEVKVVTNVPGTVAGLAVDWLSDTIYWTDSLLQRVAAVTGDGRHERCVACREVNQPRDIVVHPIKNLVIWTDVDPQEPRIEKLDMLTSRRQRIPLRVNDRPRSLAIDFKHDLLYWSEGARLCRADLNGRGPDGCSSPSDPASLAVKSLDIVHDFLVWTGFREGISVSDKEEDFEGVFANSAVLLPDEFYSDLLYFHHTRQPLRSNPCADNNGGCEHFCISAVGGMAQCACATGYWIRRNGSCVSGFVEEDFVLVTDPVLGGIYQQFLYTPEYYVIPVKHTQRPSDVVYDKTTRKMYWSDLRLGAIFRAHLNGSHQEIVFAHQQFDKLILDAGGQLLLFIDTTKQRVGVIALETMTYKIIVHRFLHVYHDIAFHVSTGHIYLSASPSRESQSYVSDDIMPSDAGSILRCDVSGENMTEVVTVGGEPRGLAASGNGLYWINTDSRTLNVYNITTGYTSQLAQLPDWSRPDDITLLGNYVYCTDEEKPNLYRLNLRDTTMDLEQSGESALFRIKGVSSSDDVQAPHEATSRPGPRDVCRHDDVTSPQCSSVHEAIATVRETRGFCRVPAVQNGRSLSIGPGAYVSSDGVVTVECKPGFGEPVTRRRSLTSRCRDGSWDKSLLCVWSMTYNVTGSRSQGFYVVLTSSTDFVIPEGVTYVDALVIGGGGGGVRACTSRLDDVRRAGDGGTTRLGRHLRAGGGVGGTLHAGGRGGFGTVFFGGAGEISSRCLGGGAAGQTTWSGDCTLGSTSCPFCGAGGAPPSCSLCQRREGGCRGPWALPGHGSSADSFGGGATGLAGGGGGGGGGYSRRFVDVTPGETIPVTVGRGGRPSASRAGGGVVVVAWGGRLEDVLPVHGVVGCRGFDWAPGSVGEGGLCGQEGLATEP